MNNLVRKEKKNNKGFSLVELIVVIAIMAVLVGVIAPQFLGYVKKSRASTDIQNAQVLASEMAVNYADAEGTTATPPEVKTVWTDITAGMVTKLPARKVKDAGVWQYQMDAKGAIKVGVKKSESDAVELYPTPTTNYGL